MVTYELGVVDVGILAAKPAPVRLARPETKGAVSETGAKANDYCT